VLAKRVDALGKRRAAKPPRPSDTPPMLGGAKPPRPSDTPPMLGGAKPPRPSDTPPMLGGARAVLPLGMSDLPKEVQPDPQHEVQGARPHH